MIKMEQNNRGGVGFIGLLQLVFIVLKLCNVIDWSWFYVLFPFIFFVFICVVVVVICVGVGLWRERKS